MLGSVRVLDLTWVLGGPFAGQLLAQLGAEVIKIEPPEGDSSRGIPPYFDGDSGFFISANQGKRSISIDLKHPDGKRVFNDLVRGSDAVIYGFAPDVPRRLGIDFDTLSAINSRICVVELIGLHDNAEYARAPAYDVIVQAMGGIMSITGEAGGAPARVGYQIGDLAGGLYMALALTAALVKSRKEQKGSRIQISLLDCQLALLTWQAQNYFITGQTPSAMGSRNPVLAPSEVYRCADGRYLAVSPTGVHFWEKFCQIIGRPDLPEDARFSTRPARIENRDALSSILAPLLAQRTAKDWSELFFAERVPATTVLDVGEAMRQPVARMRGMMEQSIKPETGHALNVVGNPFKYADRQPLSYPPALGADTKAVLREVCRYSDEEIENLIATKAVYKERQNDKTQRS